MQEGLHAQLEEPSSQEVLAASLQTFHDEFEAEVVAAGRDLSFTELLLGDPQQGFQIGADALSPDYRPVAPSAPNVGGLGNSRNGEFSIADCLAPAIAR